MLALAILGLAAVPTTYAWGALGHDTVAYIAQNYVKASTATWAQKILADTSTSYLANYATWADSYRYTTAGKFSAPYHFIDAEDSPPSSCSVDYDRDCGKSGCSVSAITNYTQRVQEPSKLSATEVNYALRFIIHFVGDITQPLHDEALLVGGNDIKVTFDGTATELHAIWDTNMPEELRGGYTLADAAAWAKNLSSEIDSGIYKSAKASWIAGLDVTDPKTTAMGWASDANQYVCSVVMPNGYQTLETGDLYPKYYNSAISTIELQIAKAGYRLAAWLDAIADASSASKKRFVRGEQSNRRDAPVDLTGADLLPRAMPLSKAKLAREAVGWDCGHKH